MRILPTALAISAVVHGLGIVWVRSRPVHEPEPAKLVTIEEIQVVPAPAAEPVPTEVTLLDHNTVVAAAPVASSRGNTKPGKTKQHVAAHATTTETPPATVETPPPRNSLMTMRHKTIENGPSSTFWERFAANTKPLQPKDIASEQLSDEIATAEGNLGNQRWIDNATSEEVAAERAKLIEKRYERSTAELQPDGEGTKSDHRTFKAKFNPDGTVASIDDKANLQRKGLLGGEFDVTDAMMRSKGIDPYSSNKLKVLDDTREERVAIGKRYRTQQLAQSKQLMQKNLERLWAMTHDPAARKAGLFELWDDCAETGSDELVAGGASARTHVIGFIRSKLPAGSAEAFTDEDVARFNKQRKSRETFAPYETM